MSENQPIHEGAVDRRAETVTSQPPGSVTMEEATRAVTAERRQWVLELTHSFINNWIYDN